MKVNERKKKRRILSLIFRCHIEEIYVYAIITQTTSSLNKMTKRSIFFKRIFPLKLVEDI